MKGKKLSIEMITKLIPSWKGKSINIQSINNGITNINFKVLVDEKAFFLTVPDSDSQLLNIDFSNKYYNNKICGSIGISPRVVNFIEPENILVTDFIVSNPPYLKLNQNSGINIQLIKTIKTLHNTKPFLQNFDMFELINYYLRLLKRRKIELPKSIDKYSKTIDNLGKILALYRNHLVPCHNDIVPENIINSHHQIYLIDFDYSGNNDFCFDLGNLSVEMGYNENQVNQLVKYYCGTIQEKILFRVYLQSIVSDIGWSLWGYLQARISSLDYDFKKYASNRWERAVNKLESKDYKIWLACTNN